MEKENNIKARIVRLLLLPSGDKIEVPANVACMSRLIADMLQENGDGDADGVEEISLPVPTAEINKQILEKAFEFCAYHITDPLGEVAKPLKSNKMRDIVPPWYASYADGLSENELYGLILASTYLDINPLLDVVGAKLASMIKGKTADEIRAEFNIPIPKAVEIATDEKKQEQMELEEDDNE